VPAVLVCEPGTANLRVAGLTLTDRFILAAHRAGFAPIFGVLPSGMQEPATERAQHWGIIVQWVRQVPEISSRMLLATTSALVTVDSLRILKREGGRLTGDHGDPIPAGLITGPVPTNVSLDRALDLLPSVSSEGVGWRVIDRPTARAAGRALWDSVSSSTDGLVDRTFNRPCGRVLSKLLVWTPVSPNTVSIISILIGVVAAWLFADGDYAKAIGAAILFQISAIVDCVDGDIARVAFKESALGKWLDLAGDQVVHVSVFGGIALGLMQSTPGVPARWLGLSAIAGALLSFAVVVRGLRQPPSEQKNRMQKLIDGATNRDFSVLVLVLAVAGKLELFLWLTALGSHVFWLALLILQLRATPAAARIA
jgi:1L-myo-inositol 1-phosphate cytidylyltransferase / CDP-L-myo-inositol myo-inositolphosphotransferase